MPPHAFVPRVAACLATLAAVVAPLPAQSSVRPDRPLGQVTIAPNDNTTPAGVLRDGVLTVSLVATTGTWYPDGPGGPELRTEAFAVAGGHPSTPGPLLRAPVGTTVRVSVTNTLDSTIWVHGFGDRRGVGEPLVVARGATKVAEFVLGEAGLFYYAASFTSARVWNRLATGSQLHGVIMAHPGSMPPAERIFVISSWFTLVGDSTVSGLGPNATLAINGRSWPATERIHATQGDSIRWRVVNMTPLEHPMHLHGFYFRVDGRGDGIRDTVYTAEERRLAVTELVLPGQTMAMTWSPERSGNWLFHCHFASHISSRAALEQDRRMPHPGVGTPAHGGHDSARNHMEGLVIGIVVAPRGEVTLAGGTERPIRLLIRSRPNVYGDYAGYAYVLGGSAAEAVPDSLPLPGPLLELSRGQPVAVTIINRSHEPAAVHWHGIELESFPDGVPGWSGSGTNTLPLIAPADSLTVRFTPPRSGTFMYHSHSNEFQQISSGLYGAIVVRDGDVPADPLTDQVMLFSDDGPTVNFATQPPPATRVNGNAAPAPLEVRADTPHRLRLANIRTDHVLSIELHEDGRPALWRVVAKDGAATSAVHSRPRVARILLAPGEIADVEFSPSAGRRYAVRHRLEFFGDAQKAVEVPVIIR